MKAGFATG